MKQKKNFQPAPMGTARKGIVTCGKGFGSKEFSAVVYDDFSGFPLLVTFLGERWWVTSPGEHLQPLDDFLGDDSEYIFLCEAGGKVGALALAKMLGQALEFPEDDVMEVLHRRVTDLKRLDVTLDVKDESLLLELEVFEHGKDSHRQGKFSVWCYARSNCYEQLFDIDAFDTKQEAEDWAMCYFEFLQDLGIEFTVI